MFSNRRQGDDGSRNPRRAGAFFDAMAALTIVAGGLVGFGVAADGSVPAGLLIGAAALLSGMGIHASAVVMRWMAALYELAARGFEPAVPAASEGRPGDAGSGRSHRRAA